VALELRPDDFRRVAQGPKAVVCGQLGGGITGTGTGRNYAGPTRTLGAPGPDGDLNASAGSGMALPRQNKHRETKYPQWPQTKARGPSGKRRQPLASLYLAHQGCGGEAFQ
jgi:hypothetical protein